MLELTLTDGKKIYVPQCRVVMISEDASGQLVAAVDGGHREPQWHNIMSFMIIREGQRIGR